MNQSYYDGFMTKCAQSNLSYETAMQLWDFSTMMKSAQAQQIRKGNGSLVTGINNVLNNAQDLWNGVSNGVANGARSVGNAVSSAWDAAGNALDKATTGNYNTQDGRWWERAGNRAENAYENATNYLGDAAEGAGMMASDAVTAGKNYLTALGNRAVDLGNRAVDHVQRTGKRIEDMRNDHYRRQRERAERTFQAGKDMVNSAVNSGKRLWNRFKGWGKNVYNNVADAYNNGRQAVEGLGQTLSDSAGLRQNGIRQQNEAARIQRAKAEYDAARQAQFSNSSPRTQRAAQRANMAGN